MDLRTFKRKVAPARRGSKIAPYLKQVQQLRSDGYTLRQVCEFLAFQKVRVTVAGLSVFLIRQERKPPPVTRVLRRRG